MIPVIIFAGSMLVYVMTLAPTISFFDSGEMIAGAYTVGVSHPPGYPVYVTLGKLFSFLPINNVAYRVNLMSSFFAAMTAVMIYYITRAILDDEEDNALTVGGYRIKWVSVPEIAGLFSAFAFSLSYNLWAWAVVSKFYTLNAFVVSCILMLLIKWRKARTIEGGGHAIAYIYALSFVWGMAGVVHISQFVLFPMYLLYMLLVDWRVFVNIDGTAHAPEAVANSAEDSTGSFRDMLGRAKRPAAIVVMVLLTALFFFALRSLMIKKSQSVVWAFLFAPLLGITGHLFLTGVIRPKVLLAMIFFFLLGHSIYLHVPLRAAQEPLINWGGAVDWKDFLWVYNREGYPVVGGERSWGLFWEQLKSFNLVREFTWAGIPLILAGLWGHFKKDRIYFTALVFGSVFMTSVILILGNPPFENIFLLEQFYIPVYIFLAVIMGGAVYLILNKDRLGPWIVGTSLPFLVLGEVPMGYLKKAFSGASTSGYKILLMGVGCPPYIYFIAYAVLAAVIVAGLKTLMKGRLNALSGVYVSAFLVLFILYPADQIKEHYWKNDRSKNYIAFDMGSSELNFSPEFATLFTWGDSGAFPMWYLQDVEQKRPDVLLVHTPHLPLDWFLASIKRTPGELGDKSAMAGDYRKLRNYNGLKGIEQLLMLPEDFRDPASMISQLVEFNPGREFTFDYSSKYSITMPFNVYPYGPVYRAMKDDYSEQNLMIWRMLVTRGLPHPTISLDLDETKAVAIYGYVHADIGKKYAAMGLNPMAEQEFIQAVDYAPNLWETIAPYMK